MESRFLLDCYYFLLAISVLCANKYVYSYSDESTCIQNIDNSNFTDHVILAIKRGYWDCAKSSLQSSSSSVGDQEFRNHFDVQHRMILRELTLLKSTIDSYQPMSIVSPAFQWAQSASEIFLNVKFSHKIDAPATLNVEATNITILAHQLKLEGSDGKKIFKLDLSFHKAIIPEDSKYEMASVGRMTFTFKKVESPSKWNRLLSSSSHGGSKKGPSNMHKWYAIQEKYDKELEKLEDDDDADSDDDDDISNKKSKNNFTNKKTKSPSAGNNGKNAEGKISKTNTTKDVDDDVDEDSSNKEAEDETAKDILQQNRPNYNKILSLQQETQDQIKLLEEDAKTRKQELDVKWRQDKRSIDDELNSKKKELQNIMKLEIDRLNVEDNNATATNTIKVVDEL